MDLLFDRFVVLLLIGVSFSRSLRRLFVAVSIARQLDRLRRLVAQLHPQPSALRRDRQIPITEPAHEVEGLARRLLEREPKGVVLDVAFDRLAHVRRGTEVAVGRHEPLDPLVRTPEVVRADEEREPTRAVVEVGEDRAR
jgi:hypothetical protein